MGIVKQNKRQIPKGKHEGWGEHGRGIEGWRGQDGKKKKGVAGWGERLKSTGLIQKEIEKERNVELRELNKGRESLGAGQGGRARRQEKVPIGVLH